MININLIPQSVQHEHRRKTHLKRWVIASVCAMVLITLPWCYDWINQSKIESFTKDNQITSTLLQEAESQLQVLTQNVQEAEIKLQRAKSLRQKRAWSGLITLIAQALPAQSWVISIATIPEMPTGSTPRVVRIVSQSTTASETPPVTMEVPRKLKLIGYAVDASEPMRFVANLKSFGVFNRVTLLRSYLEAVEDGKYFRFELICEW